MPNPLESPESVPRCPICGGRIPLKRLKKGRSGRPPKNGVAKIYCSENCADEANRRNIARLQSQYEQTETRRKRCPTCGRLEPIKRKTRLPIVE
jgi:hypothetical protein